MKNNQLRFLILTLGAGGLLALMIFFNSQLAVAYSPIEASWFAHGIGGLTALVLMLVSQRISKQEKNNDGKTPLIAYLGGLPGAFTVLLAGYTVNSYLGLSGTLALAIIGQILFSLLSDSFGWFGLVKKKIALKDIASLLLITGGSLLIILASGEML